MANKPASTKAAMRMVKFEEEKFNALSKGSQRITNKSWGKNLDITTSTSRGNSTNSSKTTNTAKKLCNQECKERRERGDVSSVMRNMWQGTNVRIRRYSN